MANIPHDNYTGGGRGSPEVPPPAIDPEANGLTEPDGSAEDQQPARSLLIGPAVVLVLAGVAVGGYYAYRYLNREPEQTTNIQGGQAAVREKRPVPEVRFTDVTGPSGVNFVHTTGAAGQKLLPETMGGGVAVLDYDGDGKPDLLFINGSPWPGHQPKPGEAKPTLKLYRNKGGMEFEDVTEAAGLAVTLYGMGVAVADIDNDRRPDIFVSCIGKHRLFRNVDGKRFEDVTDAAGVGGPGSLPDISREEFLRWKPPIPFGSSATFLDYDGDGRPDLFVCHYVTWSPAIDLSVSSTLLGGGRTYQQPQQLEGSLCSLYRNVDGKRFEDVSAKAGVQVTEKEGTGEKARVRNVGKSLGVIACDPDGDGWPDLFVANDTVRNFFFHNQPDGAGGRKLVESGFPLGAAYADNGRPRGGMGVDWAEFAPGRCAAVIANFANEPLTWLEKDRQRLRFTDTALPVGLAGPSRSALKFGTFFFDYDNDGRPDLLVANGHIEPDIAKIQASQQYAQAPQLYWNTGDGQCYFEPATPEKAGKDLFQPMVGRGSAFADLDGDGDLDVVLVANGGPARVLRNDAPRGNHFLRLDLRGDGTKTARSAIGATATVKAGDKTFTQTVAGGRGYLSQSELVLHFGLGGVEKVDAVTVRWPGDVPPETWTSPAVDKLHVLNQGEGK
ncbi:MAG: CRTAC1 family protein [Gemmataceae bacterium]|nr:CRTAC1 family protein [Gemmataceae bacterium]